MKRALFKTFLHGAVGTVGSRAGSDTYSKVRNMRLIIRKCKLCGEPRPRRLPLCEAHIKEYIQDHFKDESMESWTNRIQPRQRLGHRTLVWMARPLYKALIELESERREQDGTGE